MRWHVIVVCRTKERALETKDNIDNGLRGKILVKPIYTQREHMLRVKRKLASVNKKAVRMFTPTIKGYTMPITHDSISTDTANKIATAFKQKAAQSGVKQGSKAYRNMHFDYFYGAIQALDALGYECPPIWALNLMSSRDISDNGKPI